MDLLPRLQQWYRNQCNDDWEHQYGVRIETLDNPGWSVKIDLVGTSLESRRFLDVAEGIGADDHPLKAPWIQCSIRDGSWQGAGDETQLSCLLGIFLDWAESNAETD